MGVASLGMCALLFRRFSEFSSTFLFAVCLVGVCIASFYDGCHNYLPELFLTRVRATGQGLAFNFGRILATSGVWQMGKIMAIFENSDTRAETTISLIYLGEMAPILRAPETRGSPLPD